MKFKFLSIFVLVSLVTISGVSFKADTVLASCDPRAPQISLPPRINSVSNPVGTFNNPDSIPVVISGEQGYVCSGDPNGGLGWDMYSAGITYDIINSQGNVIAQGGLPASNQPPCTVPICAARQISINTNIDASSWPAGNYTMEILATGPEGDDDPINTPPHNTDTASSTFIITRDTPTTPYYTPSCSPATQLIAPGGTTSFNITTTAYNGFNSTVTFTSAISPSTGTLPTVSFTNNGATPNATTTAVVNTTGSTTPGLYTLTFTGNPAGVPPNCGVQLIVGDTLPAGFSFTITPNPKSVIMGTEATFTVTAVCVGGFNGTIDTLAVPDPKPFTNATYTFSPTSITCNSPNNVTTLTVGNTGAVPQSQLSTTQAVLYKTITVTGQEAPPVILDGGASD